MKNLYQPAAAEEIKRRLTDLRSDSPRQWGTMTPAQATAHCAVSLESALGEKNLPRVFIGRILGRMIKPLALRDDAPLRRNSPTAKGLIIHNEPDLKAEQERLRALIDRFVTAGPSGCTTHPHAFFGPMTPDEWAILTYKHLDHHLRQFGV